LVHATACFNPSIILSPVVWRFRARVVFLVTVLSLYANCAVGSCRLQFRVCEGGCWPLQCKVAKHGHLGGIVGFQILLTRCGFMDRLPPCQARPLAVAATFDQSGIICAFCSRRGRPDTCLDRFGRVFQTRTSDLLSRSTPCSRPDVRFTGGARRRLRERRGPLAMESLGDQRLHRIGKLGLQEEYATRPRGTVARFRTSPNRLLR
jgi:hypothetical protein